MSRAGAQAAARAEHLLMPRRALGRLLELGEKVAGITGIRSMDLSRKMVVVMAGDHGVTAEGVSAYPSEVTGQMVRGFAAGMAGINVLCRHAGIGVRVVDMGCARRPVGPRGQRRRWSTRGWPRTANMRRGPAMSRDQALAVHRAGRRTWRAALPRKASA